MNRRRLVLVLLPFALAACAGVAFAVPHATHRATHAHARPAPTHTPRPTPIETPKRTDLPVVAPATGHHSVSGPEPVTETHIIHTTGSVGVSSGTIAHGDDVRGAVGTPKPKR